MKIERHFWADGSRYFFDGRLVPNGYAQLDTTSDAPYFGTWASPKTLEIWNYAEGDVTRTICENVGEFCSEVRRIAAWHRGNESWRGLDPMGDDRAELWMNLGLGDLFHPRDYRHYCLQDPNAFR